MQPTAPTPAAPAKTECLHDVFISYSRQDKEFAWRLAAVLSTYTPPRSIGAQRRLNVFIDKDDLAGHDYFVAIEKHLAQSRKLIVVCSPRARASEYVGDEIRRFARSRGAEHVIPVLLSGVPNNEATPEQLAERAFPDALNEAAEMPLATSYAGFDPKVHKVNGGMYYAAWYTVLAQVFDVGRAVIEERDRKRRVRVRNIWIAATGVLILVLSTLTVWAMIERKAAERRGAINLAARMSAQARVATGRQQDAVERRVLLAAEAVRILQDLGEDTESAAAVLGESLALLPRRILRVGGGTSAVWFSRDGQTAAVATGKQITAYQLPSAAVQLRIDAVEPIRSLSGDMTGRRLIGVGESGAAYAWVDGKPDPNPPLAAKENVLCAAWSADGQRTATVSQAAAGLRLAVYGVGKGEVLQDGTARLAQQMIAPTKGQCLDFGDNTVLARVSAADGSSGLTAIALRGSAIAGPWMGVYDAVPSAEGKVLLAGPRNVRHDSSVELITDASGFARGGVYVFGEDVLDDPVIPLMKSVVYTFSWRDSRDHVGTIAEAGGDYWIDPLGRYMATGNGGEVRIYLVSGGSEVVRFAPDYPVSAVVFDPSGRYVAARGAQGQLEVQDIAHPSEIWRVRTAQLSSGVSSTGKYVASAARNNLSVFDTTEQRTVARLPLPCEPEELSLAPDGSAVAAAFPRAFDLQCSLGTSRILQVFATGPSVPAPVLTVKGAATALFSPDSGRLYVAGQNEVAAYAREGWKRLWTRPLQQFAPQQIVLSPDGRHLAVLARDEPAWSTSISVVDSADGTLRARLEAAAATAWRGDRRVLDRVAFSSDSSMIAFLADQGVVSIARLADLQTYMRLDHPGNLNDVQAIAFSRDNRYLMTISGSYASLGFPGAGAYTDQSVLTWDLSSGRIVERFPAGVDVSGDFTEAIRQNDKLYLSQPVLTPEGSHVAAAVFPNFRVYMSVAARRAPADLYVWRMQRGATDVALHVTDVTDESFIASSRDGRVFLTRGSDFEATKESTLRVWRLDADHLLRAACGRLARNLSTTEWRELIGADRPYRRTCPDLLPVPASPQRRPVSQ